jgi:hypothetical protein
MKKCVFLSILALAAMPAFATVTLSTPGNGTTVGSPVSFVASATTSCAAGVATMGIYTGPSQLAYVGNGASLKTSLALDPGTYNIVIVGWDNCGGSSTASATVTVKNVAGVYVTAPANGSKVTSPVNFTATATSSCAAGVASMGVYTAPYQLATVSNGASLQTNLPLAPGTYHTTVEEWDRCGGAATTPVTITVPSGKTFSNIQNIGGWNGYAQLPPDYSDCNSCTASGPGTTWSMKQNVASPSLSGKATQYNIGGTQAYTDVLWNNHLIGDFSSEGLPDTAHTLVPQYHTFTYDVYFYGSNLGVSQALEFDVNQFFDGLGFTWGHECRVAGGNEWDIWDNLNAKWVPTGIACNPVNNAWNHLTLQVARTQDNQLLYQSITFNGVTHTLNETYPPFSEPGWWGITVNFQQDGDSKQSPYQVYVDKLSFTYE